MHVGCCYFCWSEVKQRQTPRLHARATELISQVATLSVDAELLDPFDRPAAKATKDEGSFCWLMI